MAIQYKLYGNPPKDGKEKGYHARPVSTSTMTTEEMERLIEKETTISPSDTEGCLKALSTKIHDAILDGRIIHLRGIGSFAPLIEGEIAYNKDGKPSLKNARLQNIKFTPEGSLLKEMQQEAKFFKAKETDDEEHKLSDEEILQLLKDVLKQEPSITASEFVSISNLPHTSAYRKLQKFVEQGYLRKEGNLFTLTK